ncbi:substrate-binding domain-containing protein [Streptomyces sp. S.PB5]|uniref:PstS family phosphate ABC transporter substrate-binding protein n=1 Tax=Streptomyces sp. S.PB5 TaxID=3020844 RepID=UPI0025B27FCF|nr:substrate-binding domain-containing protein [Streptomyces sp. S.PB5]MDN3026409.1 substrate-binding domain-containing protein [Streptomyces sp. S.PB5]
MEWLNAENAVAVGTAVLGIVASGVLVWYERRVPRRKRIGYRVQMDNPIGDDVRSGRAGGAPSGGVRLGLFNEAPDMADATLVLLRVENDGSQGIDRDDYTGPTTHGLTAVFTDRTIRGVSVTQPTDRDHLMDHFTPERGFAYEGNILRIPRVPLNRGDHFKLLVLLSGGDVGRAIRLTGGLRDGEVHPNRSATPDETPPILSGPARILTALLTLSVVALAGIILATDDTRPPLGCEKGTLTVTGSTAFAPVVRTLAKEYEKDCEGAEITVEARGSEAGAAELAADDPESAVIAFTDGPMGDRLDLHGEKVALSAFTLVVNERIGLGRVGLTRAEVRRLYSGEITRWRQLDPALPDLPVVLVSRNADSGTQQIFQRRVLGTWERVPSTSLDCVHKDDRSAPVVRCELGSTEQVLDKVAEVPGAIGYSELAVAGGREGLLTVPLDGVSPSVQADNYPYRGVEYAYTRRSPQPGSLTAAFLAYLKEVASQDVIRDNGHLPCAQETESCG